MDSKDVKQYIGHFGWKFLILIALAALCVLIMKNKAAQYYDSPNTQRVYGNQRVFDYGNRLSDKEEEKLEEYIRKAEKRICMDIVIVTLDESLKDYAAEYRENYQMEITPDKYVMVYADKFWEDNKFGYDGPQITDGTSNAGTGVILVDNLYNESENGLKSTWMGTTGKAEREYSGSSVSAALDVFYKKVDSDYYGSCKAFVDRVVKDMKGGSKGIHIWSPIAGIAFAFIYFQRKSKQKQAKKTVVTTTYITPGTHRFSLKEDNFVKTTTTKRDLSSGSGSTHTSGGGGRHGGGGHTRQ